MSEEYVVNNNDTKNPGNHHCVHTLVHAKQLRIRDFTCLGTFNTCHDALKKAREQYADVDGCKNCCPECNTD